MSRIRPIAGLAALVLCVGLLASCGGSTTSEAPAAPEASQTTAATETTMKAEFNDLSHDRGVEGMKVVDRLAVGGIITSAKIVTGN